MDIKTTILETQKIISDNSEWIDRYDGYADDILNNMNVIISNKKGFNQFSPLYFYISTTNAINAKNNLKLDVRYMGQSVATLKANQNNILISTSSYDDTNLRDFDCGINLNNISWTDSKASDFRKFFKGRKISRNTDKNNKKNEEHHVESLLLTEFSKKASTNKAITGIQPIKIGGNRFGMPTPLSASNHKKTKYSKQYGGGIDIFARTGHGKATYLTVIEVKNENNSKEPPTAALKQAIQYAVFIRELLRSKCGEKWYKIFGFKGEIPANLKIRVACAMPDNILDKSFANNQYYIENDCIECHYIYFKYNGIQLSDFQTSL